MGLFRNLKGDALSLARAQSGRTDRRALLKAVLATDSYRVTSLNRLREWATRWRVPAVNHLLRVVQTAMWGIEISKEARLGEGVFFVHPVGVVIGGDAQVGDRVQFYGNATVGSTRATDYPVIEEDVQVGAGARILGKVRVGARSRIGANAVVLQDVPPDSLAVGVPAKVRPLPREDREADALAG
jgi:serine O-acetyltransferase